MSLLKPFFYAALLAVLPFSAEARGKAMDCGECMSTYLDAKACDPICKKPVTGKKAQELYSAIQSLGISKCTATVCGADLSGLECLWSNSSDDKSMDCTYFDKNGKEKNVSGKKAKRLSDAVQSTGEIETSCGMNTCGFRNLQDLNCSELRSKGKMKVRYECRIMVANEDTEDPAYRRPAPPANSPDASGSGTAL